MRPVARFVAVLGLVASMLALSAPAASAYSGSAASAESEFLARLNATRAGAGLHSLVLNPTLSNYARLWSARLSADGYLHHDPNLAAETGAVVRNWTRAGENIGTGPDVLALHNAFYNSAPHRANMLGAYNQVGIGVVVNNGTIWVTFRYAMGTLPPPPPAPRDTTPPRALVNPPVAATQSTAKFAVGWWGDDSSGIATFDVDVSDNGAAWVRWFDDIKPQYVVGGQASGSATFFGVAGHTYSFRVRATDRARNLGGFSATSATKVSAYAPKPMPFTAAYAAARDGDISALSSVPIGRPGWNGNYARGFAARPSGGGYVLDAFGGITPTGGAPKLAASAYWRNWDIARGIALNPDGLSGYVLDGWGGLHPVGNAVTVAYPGYWPGWDIARDVILLPDSTASQPAGYVLDGYGGLHPFGNAPRAVGSPYWPGQRMAQDVVANPAGPGGWVLDGWGSLHAFGGAPRLDISAYWAGWNIARSAALFDTGSGLGGYVLDGFGGLHPVNGAPTVTKTRYWAGADVARFVSIAP
jgi:hypothetical protein